MTKKADFPRCLGCYLPIDQGIYHPKCSRRLFGQTIPPILETTSKELDKYVQRFLTEKQSITGVQRKLSLTLAGKDSNRLTIVGGLGGEFILKPSSPDYEQLPENEDLSMHLGEACGIKTALHGLLPMADGTLAYITKRFDRNGKQKLAVEDFCQLSELLTEQKYRSSHEQVGKIIRRYSALPGEDILRFFEMTVFSFLIGNNDMHLKNFSLITDDLAKIRLSPAYDLLSVRLLISEKDDPEDTALTLNGKKNKLKLKDFKLLANNLGIPENVSDRVFRRYINSASKMFSLIEESYLGKTTQIALKKHIEKKLATFTT